MHSPARQQMTITAFIFTAIALAAAVPLGFISSLGMWLGLIFSSTLGATLAWPRMTTAVNRV
jgi:hypothetical protein